MQCPRNCFVQCRGRGLAGIAGLFAGTIIALRAVMLLGQKGKWPAQPVNRGRRHDFVVLRPGPRDPFGGGGLCYTCLACRWAFVVKGNRVVVLDDDGSPMSGEEARQRLDTLAMGPCPARRY
jgi:hypothetical protein